jgi:Tfp pilus assembly protein PilN
MSGRADRSISRLFLDVSPRAAKAIVASFPPLRIEDRFACTLPEEREDAREALRALLDSHPISARPAALILNRGAATLRTLELPSTDEQELVSKLQLGKLAPYPRAEILSAWTPVGSARVGYTSVLLAIARRSLVDDLVQQLSAKGLAVSSIGVSTEGLGTWWAFAGARQASAQAEQAAGELTVIVDTDVASTDCAVLAGSQLLFAHSVAIGHAQVSQREAQLRWLAELVRLPSLLKREGIIGQIRHGVLTGLTKGWEDAHAQLEAQWGITLQHPEPLASVDIPGQGRQSAAGTGQDLPVSYTALLGHALRSGPPRIDLTPEGIRVSHSLKTRARHLSRLAGSLVAVFVLAAVLLVEQILILRQYRTGLQGRLAAVSRGADDIVAQQQVMQQIHGWMDASHGALEALHALTVSADASVTLARLELLARSQVTVQGWAASAPEALAYVERLRQQGVFTAVQATSVVAAKGAHSDGADFELRCTLSGS